MANKSVARREKGKIHPGINESTSPAERNERERKEEKRRERKEDFSGIIFNHPSLCSIITQSLPSSRDEAEGQQGEVERNSSVRFEARSSD